MLNLMVQENPAVISAVGRWVIEHMRASETGQHVDISIDEDLTAISLKKLKTNPTNPLPFPANGSLRSLD